MTLSVVANRESILEKAEELQKQRSYRALVSLLGDLPEHALREEPVLGWHLAQALFRLEEFHASWRIVQDLEGPCRRRGLDATYFRRLILAGSLLVNFGDTEHAESAFDEVLRRAPKDQQRAVAFATINLATVVGIRGDWLRAIGRFQHAIAEFSRLGAPDTIAGCHLNLAICYRGLGLHSQADSHFETAFELYRDWGSDAELDIAATEYERARLLSEGGDQRQAERLARRAVDRIASFTSGKYPASRSWGEAYLVLGIIAGVGKRSAEAKMYLARAHKLALATGVRLLEGEVHEALAKIALDHGDRAESEKQARVAAEIFMAMGAFPRAGRVIDSLQRTA